MAAPMMRALATVAAGALCGLAALPVAAQEDAGLAERVRQLEELVAEQARALDRQRRLMQRQQQALDRLGGAAPGQGAAGAAAPEAAAPAGRAPEAAPPAAPTAPPPQTAAAPPGEPPEPRERPEIAVGELVERGGVLTPPGTLVLEPSLEYVHDSSNQVLIEGLSVLPALLIGNIDVREVERDSLFGALTARAGLTRRLEADVKLPYVYRHDETTARELAVEATTSTITTVDGDGLGDVEAGLHYQLTEGNGGWPYFIGNLRVKAPTGRDPFEVPLSEQGLPLELPTGNGFWGVEPSISFLKPSDPVVWFGNLKYLWNIERDVGGGFGTIDPGDAIGGSIGLGFAVNESTSFSLGWEQQYVMDTEQDGRRVPGSSLSIGSLLLGMSYRLSDSTSLSLSFQGGMTEDATDQRIILRVPIRFQL